MKVGDRVRICARHEDGGYQSPMLSIGQAGEVVEISEAGDLYEVIMDNGHQAGGREGTTWPFFVDELEVIQ